MLAVGDLFRMPGDAKRDRVWAVEHVSPCSASVRPYTKIEVAGVEGRDPFMAMDGKRTTISATSDVEIVGHDDDLPLPRWLKKSRSIANNP